MTTHKIFISYSNADRSWAREFAKSLSGTGADVWFDEFNIKPGDSISESVEKGLRGSDMVVLLINDQSVDSSNFFFELGAAVGMNKKIVPIVPEGFSVSKLPLSVRRRKYLIRKSPKETAKELAVGLELLHGEAA
jgi:hypothetical protein